jgi:hypothetical protein
MALLALTNNDTITPVSGDIACSSGQPLGAVLALADVATRSILGVWVSSPSEGAVGNADDGQVTINCVARPSVGDKLYLSPTVAGKATSTKPTYAYYVGTCLRDDTVGVNYKAFVQFNKSDGKDIAQDSVLYQGVQAAGTATFKTFGSLANNQTLVIGGETFELKLSDYARGSITCVAPTLLLDNETFTLNDGVNTAVVFEFRKTTDAYAIGSITCTNTSRFLNNETFTLDDGVNSPVVFEFKVNGSFTATGGSVKVVDISGVTTAVDVATVVRAAINAVTTTLAITAGTPVNAVVPLINDSYGAYNTAITDTVVDANFTHLGMSGGAKWTAAGGAVRVIDIRGLTLASEVASAVRTAINASPSLAITAGTVTGATVPLVNDAYGAYNTAISNTVADAGFTHTGMAGGAAWTATGGAVVVIDCAGQTTLPLVTGVAATLINSRSTNTVTATATATGLTWTEKRFGVIGNTVASGTALSASTITTYGNDTATSYPTGTVAQRELIYVGQKAVVAAPILAWASLANGQTFVTITPAGAADSRTINAALALSTDRPTFCAALAADLNTTGGGTTAYVWTVNGTSDGLIGTAKTPGVAFNLVPTGTALVSGLGSITTLGIDAQTDTVSTLQDALRPGSMISRPTGQTSRGWFDITDAPNGDRWATVYGVDIFKQARGTALFVAQNAGALGWTGITVTDDGSIYAGVNSGDVWENRYGTGVFIALGYANRVYARACTHPNGVDILFSSAGGATGGVWKRTAQAGDFVEQGIATYSCTGVAVTSDGVIWTSVYNDNMYKKIGNAPFISQSQANLAWLAVTAARNDDLYAVTSNGDVFRRRASGGNFVAQGQSALNWYSIKGMRTGEVLSVVNGGDVHQHYFEVLSALPF